MLSSSLKSPSGSKHRASFAPGGTASCRRWARCVRLSEQAELRALAFIGGLRHLGHAELVETFSFFTVGFGEGGRIEPLVNFNYGAVVGQMLISEEHPFQELAIFR